MQYYVMKKGRNYFRTTSEELAKFARKKFDFEFIVRVTGLNLNINNSNLLPKEVLNAFRNRGKKND